MLKYLLGLYRKKHVSTSVSVAVQLIPMVGGSLDTLIKSGMDALAAKRAKIFFSELQKYNPINEELLLSEDYLHFLTQSLKSAVQTKQEEKIRMFARVLRNSYEKDSISDTGELEDFIKILDELSFREIQILHMLDAYSDTPRNGEKNDFKWTSLYWDKFEARLTNELNISQSEVSDIMNRIVRTGCFETYTGRYLNGETKYGKLTNTYFRLKRVIYDFDDDKDSLT